MKKQRPNPGDRSRVVSAKQLASVRGGGIQGTGVAADNGVIHMPHDNGVIHLD